MFKCKLCMSQSLTSSDTFGTYKKHSDRNHCADKVFVKNMLRIPNVKKTSMENTFTLLHRSLLLYITMRRGSIVIFISVNLLCLKSSVRIHHRIIRNIVLYNSSCPYHAVITNLHTLQNYTIGANPSITSNHDWFH